MFCGDKMNVLCKLGFHKYKIVRTYLVPTLYPLDKVCQRCGKVKTNKKDTLEDIYPLW